MTSSFNAANEAKQRRLIARKEARAQVAQDKRETRRRDEKGRPLEYWLANARGRMPVGPYPTAHEALANGYSVALRGLWWVEAQVGTVMEFAGAGYGERGEARKAREASRHRNGN